MAVQRPIISMLNTQNLWKYNPEAGGIVLFDPPLTTPQADPGNALWTDDSGRIIASARQVSPTVWKHYHYDPAVSETSWIDKGDSNGQIWDYDGTSYNNVWSCAGDAHSIMHFNGSVWTLDATLTSTRMVQIDCVGTGLDEVFCAAYDHVWFRTSGDIGSGVWEDKRAQLYSDTGLDISGALPDCRGVWAASKNEVYWLIAGSADGTQHWIVKWNGANFSIISTPLVNNYAISDSSFDGISGSQLWWMQADVSWGQFRFVLFNGTNIVRQTIEHNLGSGCKLMLVSGSLGYAAGKPQGATQRIDLWQGNGSQDGWSELDTKSVSLASGSVGLAFWAEVTIPVLPTGPDSAYGLGSDQQNAVFVVAKDVIKLNFRSAMAVSSSLLDPNNYIISPGLTVTEILPLEERTTTSVFLRLSPKAMFGAEYTITIPSAGEGVEEVIKTEIPAPTFFTANGEPLAPMTASWIHHRTKVDSVLASLANMYNKQVGGNLRMMLQAIMISDEEIGGNF